MLNCYMRKYIRHIVKYVLCRKKYCPNIQSYLQAFVRLRDKFIFCSSVAKCKHFHGSFQSLNEVLYWTEFINSFLRTECGNEQLPFKLINLFSLMSRCRTECFNNSLTQLICKSSK